MLLISSKAPHASSHVSCSYGVCRLVLNGYFFFPTTSPILLGYGNPRLVRVGLANPNQGRSRVPRSFRSSYERPLRSQREDSRAHEMVA